eukprot:Nitzschia sp. Nitz4//scaffold26_size159584//134560//137421//NITZ4_002516-RA/size159584-processed-gene-0.87-mRNA-1//-1//CDS//3329545157//6038//frame0
MANPKNGYGSIPPVDSENGKDSDVTDRSASSQWGRKMTIGISLFLVVSGFVAFASVGHSEPTMDNSLLRLSYKSSMSNASQTDNGLSPEELGFLTVERSDDLKPSKAWGEKILQSGQPLPTNIWYMNLISPNAGTPYNTEASRVYTVPYIVDTVGAIPGIRVHWPVLQAASRNMQMVVDTQNALTIGATSVDPAYTVATDEWSLLGVSLQWNQADNTDNYMVSHVVRGMPYATMEYITDGKSLIPTLQAGKFLASPPKLDGSTELKCGNMVVDGDTVESFTSPMEKVVEKEIIMHFKGSDFTWAVFVSQPVVASCASVPDPEVSGTTPDHPGVGIGTSFQLRLKPLAKDKPLVLRAALADECTTGKADIQAHCKPNRRMKDADGFLDVLRKYSSVFPTGSADVDLEFPIDTQNVSHVHFDWQAMDSKGESVGPNKDLIMFSLPHHQEMMQPDGQSENVVMTDYCKPTFHGSTCLVRGHKWVMEEELEPKPSFYGARPPKASLIPTLAQSLTNDIEYHLSDNLQRGAADTYFSGKILSRLGRVILMATELRELAAAGDSNATLDHYVETALNSTWFADSVEAAKAVDLPSDEAIQDALDRLREGVEIWISNKGEAPYLYDSTWGGFVNCGCNYELPKGWSGDRGYCSNQAPDCPALSDVNVDFGNGYYNDHHYHYGYHVYAAAVVAKMDPEWGNEWFDRVLMYIRDIASDSKDTYFPRFRHKDWYLGSSWASGLASFNEVHGRNQESSSEAIAAYEGVALFGGALVDDMDSPESRVGGLAKRVHQVGRLLMSTELHATHRYWHVWNSTKHVNTYPAEYQEPVVGMLYETMGSFQTWFSGGDMASMGIQLLPFTPASEARDDPDWAAQVYPPYHASCRGNFAFCVKNGWSVMLSGLKATVGYREQALKDALEIPDSVFASEGGCGHSRSNTIWYIATRPEVANVPAGELSAIYND